jgi:hypothetical protein
LSVLACAVPVPTTVPVRTAVSTTVVTTPLPTVVKPPTTPATPGSQTATVVKPVVRVHAAPDSDEITGYLSSGDEVTILECDGDWCQIKNPDGFVFRGCLSDNPKRLGCQAK